MARQADLPVYEQLQRLSVNVENRVRNAHDALMGLETLEEQLPRDATVRELFRVSIRSIRQELNQLAEYKR